ncbi:MAG: OmpA family protein [Bacteroidetes bacterium]|nr:OmpA family protein [Bacteroidota bacterium]MCL1968800.1 OmpA family protein [Bacteroidota bacterium]
MKIIKILSLSVMVALIATCCVTKSKYKELDAKYQKCTEDLNYTTSEKIDFENKSKDLASEVAALKIQIQNLKEDTSSIRRRVRIIERQLDKTKGDYDELLKSFTDQNITKNALLAEKEARLNELQSILDQKDAEVKALRNKVANALKGFEDMGLTIYEKNGKVYVSLDEKLLFASGSWDIDSKGKEALTELGKVLANDTNINVVIEGHTDNVPYRGSGYIKDNWDLSVMRATAVVKELLKNKEINPQRISASGRSEYVPIDNEDSKEARAKNRRTEIILTPRLDELFQIIDSQ